MVTIEEVELRRLEREVTELKEIIAELVDIRPMPNIEAIRVI